MLIAEATTSASGLSGMEIFLALCGFFSTIAALYVAFAKKSQKREVAFDPGIATRAEFDKLSAHNEIEHAKLWAKLDSDRSAFESNASRRTAGTYEKIDSVRKELKADLATQTARLEERMDGIPDRVIATLKNTGAI